MLRTSRQLQPEPSPTARRFEGPVLEELLKEVRATLGRGATIVAASKLRNGGIGGFFARETFEVVAEPPGHESQPAPRDPVDALLAAADAVSAAESAADGAHGDVTVMRGDPFEPLRPELLLPPVMPDLATESAAFADVLARIADDAGTDVSRTIAQRLAASDEPEARRRAGEPDPHPASEPVLRPVGPLAQRQHLPPTMPQAPVLRPEVPAPPVPLELPPPPAAVHTAVPAPPPSAGQHPPAPSAPVPALPPPAPAPPACPPPAPSAPAPPEIGLPPPQAGTPAPVPEVVESHRRTGARTGDRHVAAATAQARQESPLERSLLRLAGPDVPREALRASLARLPSAPALPTAAGAVAVVVGERRHALAAARRLARELGIAPDEVVLASPGYRGRQRAAALLVSNAVTAEEHRRSWRRRSCPIVVAVEAPCGHARAAHWACEVLDALEPALVWGTVHAGRRCEDVATWVRDLGGIDALDLTDTRHTYGPHTLLRLGIPVAQIDGEDATPEHWVSLLAEAA